MQTVSKRRVGGLSTPERSNARTRTGESPVSPDQVSYVTVDDNGPGVPPADRQRVLQRFERGGGSGSGLGLAIAHQVATAHGGGVWITTSPLGGARVVLTLAPSALPPPQTLS